MYCISGYFTLVYFSKMKVIDVKTKCHCQGRIIHEAGEAEASGPPVWTDRYNDNLQSRTSLGPEISRENLRYSKIFAERHLDPSKIELKLECNAQRDGRPAEHRCLCSTPQSLADAHY